MDTQVWQGIEWTISRTSPSNLGARSENQVQIHQIEPCVGAQVQPNRFDFVQLFASHWLPYITN